MTAEVPDAPAAGGVPALPPVVPEVTARAVEGLTSRLRRRLDAAAERFARAPVRTEGTGVRVDCGEDAKVTLEPGPSGAVTEHGQARCCCLLAPRCLHLAAVLAACPVAGPAEAEVEPEPAPEPSTGPQAATARAVPPGPGPEAARAPGPAQVAAASGLWQTAAAVLAAGIPGAGALPQAELLRAAHAARLAGLRRAEAAALRVVRGLRAARDRHPGHRLADLSGAFRELLLVSGALAAASPDPGLLGTARRGYEPGGGLRVYGICREPVITATGYAGVVTHLLGAEGRQVTLADVRPGRPGRARAAGTAAAALGGGALDHQALARRGLLVAGATLSPDGRLGAGRSVRATPLGDAPWTSGPVAALFARPLRTVAAEHLAAGAGPSGTGAVPGPLLGCDLEITGARGGAVHARERTPGNDGGRVAVRLLPADGHPELAHSANLQRLAEHPGLGVRLVARLDPGRAATLLPLAVGPVPGAERTLRLPDTWLGRADLGYDRLQGAHLPRSVPASPSTPPPAPDPLADAPLWRVRNLVELAVAGGRRTLAEAGRGPQARQRGAALRRAGFGTAAALADALTTEAGRRSRDAFGRPADSASDAYARAWLAASVHLSAAEHALVRGSWGLS